jgi:hypothetical protein
MKIKKTLRPNVAYLKGKQLFQSKNNFLETINQ